MGANSFSFHSQAPAINLLPPAADAAGRTGSWHSLRNVAGKIEITCVVDQGNASPVTFSPYQALDVNGTSAKAIPAVYTFMNSDVTQGDALVPNGDAASVASGATTKTKIITFEFDVSELDLADGFNHITVETSASNAANITYAELRYIGRYQQDAPPTSLV